MTEPNTCKSRKTLLLSSTPSTTPQELRVSPLILALMKGMAKQQELDNDLEEMQHPGLLAEMHALCANDKTDLETFITQLKGLCIIHLFNFS
jgi:hypothetical protein